MPRPYNEDWPVSAGPHQSGSSRSTSTTCHPAVTNRSRRCWAESTIDRMSVHRAAAMVFGLPGSLIVSTRVPFWSRTEHHSYSSGERRTRHMTRPSPASSGNEVVAGTSVEAARPAPLSSYAGACRNWPERGVSRPGCRLSGAVRVVWRNCPYTRKATPRAAHIPRASAA